MDIYEEFVVISVYIKEKISYFTDIIRKSKVTIGVLTWTKIASFSSYIYIIFKNSKFWKHFTCLIFDENDANVVQHTNQKLNFLTISITTTIMLFHLKIFRLILNILQILCAKYLDQKRYLQKLIFWWTFCLKISSSTFRFSFFRKLYIFKNDVEVTKKRESKRARWDFQTKCSPKNQLL